MSTEIKSLVKEARSSSHKLINLDTKTKNRVLKDMALAILGQKKFILRENQKDIVTAISKKLKKSFIDRLTLNEKRLKEMSASLLQVASLADPVGKTILVNQRPNGIRVKKVRTPIGVVLVIYEARPNVTSDCIGLLFKTSNVGILRGGSSAFYSNKAIAAVLEKALKKNGINFAAFFVVESKDHKVVDELLKQNKYIDLVIPRGGEDLIRKVVNSSRIPVIKHYKGICHIFVDKSADIKKALKICLNAKVQRPSVCNAVETILVHKDIAKRFLPLLRKEFDAYKVEIRGDEKTAKIICGIKKASQKDWLTEYLDLIVAVKVVNNIEEAISHINTYGSGHTESIITKNKANADKFVREVDSACCFVNISTRFSDGYQFGLGAEIGISTDKIHARGPMGLEELTTYKWVGIGNGQIRE
ncbi:MAG: glutamate-5-semialdehyde dehydrogenase [Candidatus Omnitrophica bacterium]|nr:glutamate-5-semialdehyde dehydrogenase [Candidatus Omnitrophota bacterium]